MNALLIEPLIRIPPKPFQNSSTTLDSFINIWYYKTTMKADLVYHEKKYIAENAFREIRIWRVPESKDKPHGYKYSFVYIVNGQRIIGYDNAEGKGDHRHYKQTEYPYKFQGLDKLWKDFMNDIKQFKEKSHEGKKHKNSD